MSGVRLRLGLEGRLHGPGSDCPQPGQHQPGGGPGGQPGQQPMGPPGAPQPQRGQPTLPANK